MELRICFPLLEMCERIAERRAGDGRRGANGRRRIRASFPPLKSDRDFFLGGGGKLLGPGAERLQLPGWGCAALRAAGFGCDLSGLLALGVPALRAQGWRS